MGKSIELLIHLDEESRAYVAKEAAIHVRMASVAQAKHELAQSQQETIRLSPADQLAFWKALEAKPQLTPAQRELGKLMRGECF